MNIRNRISLIALAFGMGTAPSHTFAQAEPGLEFAFEEIVTLGPGLAVGETPRGMRNMIPITGGTFEGPGIKGTIIPGGWDWQLTRGDGCTEIEADYMLRTDDGVVINVINEGVLCPPKDGKPVPVRTQPRFEAPLGKYEWLNSTAFIGTLEMATGLDEPAVKIRFYKAI
ncbi:hypothetical protein FHS61_001882 [Altererythrobacter atlanticus]|uniref:UPF0311 protein WYH_00331 n=1 Tax=Croceibacterium atlanticum TaxID=1267766 RepID=A0A0F7KPB2_9SPHN|nr:DUF3237 domain-containing protein [Croceibacterium atlanticum]AKH41394.1 hypothetical protein WYH_00331 [Croceibacterium atlanticum]MBB5732856.1 hypothetical protein [Croceibacterium atlanticum]